MLNVLKRFRGVGGLPPAMRAQFEPEGILFVAERVGVRQRFSGSVPGRHDALGVSRHKGLVIATRERLYAMVPTMPRLHGPAIDQPWSTDATGPATATLDAAGVSLHITLKRVDPRFSGDVTTSWKFALDEAVLATLPTRRLSFDVSPDYVFSSLGVRVRP
jgi:hypothetical protein